MIFTIRILYEFDFYCDFSTPFCFRSNFWRDPFEALCHYKQLSEFYVMDVEDVEIDHKAGHGFISKKHSLADAWLVRSNQVAFVIVLLNTLFVW